MGRGLKDRIRGEAKRLLEAGVAGRVFPGGVACVAYREGGQLVYALAAGGTVDLQGGAKVLEDTPYDLASLTKPFVATAAMRLEEQGVVDFGVRVDSMLPDVRGGPGGGTTLEQLFSHRSGLAAWGGLYLDVPHDPGTAAARRWILSEAARRAEGPAGQKTVYSDLGYMIAGEAIARASGDSLDVVVEREVTAPIGIERLVYYAGALPADRRADLARRAAPTERCDWRGQIVCGEVHDENSAALGGVSGHAGLFGTAQAVARFGREILAVHLGESDFLKQATLHRALEKRDEEGRYRLGWDTKSGSPSSAGRHMSDATFGHLGFTGTSIWIDPLQDVVIVLLTNRVHPSRANEKIRGFRPAFHDGVMSAMRG